MGASSANPGNDLLSDVHALALCKNLPGDAVASHPYVRRQAEHDIPEHRQHAAFTVQPDVPAGDDEELREQPLRDRVVEAVKKDGWPQTPRQVRFASHDERDWQVADREEQK